MQIGEIVYRETRKNFKFTHVYLKNVCQDQHSIVPTSFGFQTLSLQMVTSVKAALACIRATVKTALGNTRAPVWKAMKAKTVNYVSFSSRYAFMPELPEESKLGTRGKQLKHARKQFHVTSDLEPVLRYDGPLQ